MYQPEGQIETLPGTEHPVMRPDDHIILFHQFAGGHGNIPPAVVGHAHEALYKFRG